MSLGKMVFGRISSREESYRVNGLRKNGFGGMSVNRRKGNIEGKNTLENCIGKTRDHAELLKLILQTRRRLSICQN